MVPRNRECDGRIEKHAEVVRVCGVLVEIPEIDDEPPAHSLLDAEFDLIARAWWHCLTVAKLTVQPDASGQQQVLVVRRFHRSAIRGAQYTAGSGHRKRDA